MSWLLISAAVNIGVHVSLSDLISSVCMPRSGIAGSYCSSMSSFNKVLIQVEIRNITWQRGVLYLIQ